jgi:DNA primase
LKVDGIGYLMAVHNMSFKEAAESVGKGIRFPVRNNRKPVRTALPVNFVPIPEPEGTGAPSGIWSETAGKFITWAADNLRRNPQQIERLRKERGISPETAEAWRLGWNPAPLKRPGAHGT